MNIVTSIAKISAPSLCLAALVLLLSGCSGGGSSSGGGGGPVSGVATPSKVSVVNTN